jgi:hypothetical protein
MQTGWCNDSERSAAENVRRFLRGEAVTCVPRRKDCL